MRFAHFTSERQRVTEPRYFSDIATLQHIYFTQVRIIYVLCNLIADARDVQPKGSVHFMCALGNQKWFESIGFDKEHVTELDWWDARDATITLQTGASKSMLTITCLPCQHFSALQSSALC